jgi:hypothetical protein
MQYVRLGIARYAAVADALTLGATYSKLEGGRVPMERARPPHYWPRSSLIPSAARPSLCPSHNGGAPTQRSPFPLLAGIKAQTLREEIVHLE